MTKRSTRKVLNEFCKSTSLHGYTYWYNADSVILKVAWAVVILAATCLGIVFLANQTKEYIDGRILTTIETSTAPLDVRMKNYLIHTMCITKMFPILEHYMAICHNLQS